MKKIGFISFLCAMLCMTMSVSQAHPWLSESKMLSVQPPGNTEVTNSNEIKTMNKVAIKEVAATGNFAETITRTQATTGWISPAAEAPAEKPVEVGYTKPYSCCGSKYFNKKSTYVYTGRHQSLNPPPLSARLYRDPSKEG
jgi:hypothetical protein